MIKLGIIVQSIIFKIMLLNVFLAQITALGVTDNSTQNKGIITCASIIIEQVWATVIQIKIKGHSKWVYCLIFLLFSCSLIFIWKSTFMVCILGSRKASVAQVSSTSLNRPSRKSVVWHYKESFEVLSQLLLI